MMNAHRLAQATYSPSLIFFFSFFENLCGRTDSNGLPQELTTIAIYSRDRTDAIVVGHCYCKTAARFCAACLIVLRKMEPSSL